MDISVRHESDKRVIRTKRSIKTALFDIMKTKDYSSITVSELTSAANVNRRTFYTHYKSIDDIFDEIEYELVSALMKLIAEMDRSNYQKGIYKLFLDFHTLISVDFSYYFSVIRIDMRGILISRLKSSLQSAYDSHECSGNTNSTDAKMAFAFIAGGFLNSYIEWYSSGRKQPIEEVALLISQFSINVISNLQS